MKTAGSGIIHMNGRVYDANLGRFLSPDPNITAPEVTQDYNRYSYVLNNPLSLTDPTGYSWLSKLFRKIERAIRPYIRPIIAIAASIITFNTVGNLLWAQIAASGPPTFAAVAGTHIASGAAAGFVGGGIAGGDLRSAANGAFTGGVFGALHFAPGAFGSFEKIAQHAVAGCATAAAGGGRCGAGALSAGFAEFAGARVLDYGYPVARQAVLGGVGSVLGGGKFANGAVTGAFAYLYNNGDSNRKGYAGEAQAFEDAINDGLVPIGYQISVQTPAGGLRPDLLIYDPANVELRFREAKNGPHAGPTDNQRNGGLAAIDRGDWIPIGPRATQAGLQVNVVRGGIPANQWGEVEYIHFHDVSPKRNILRDFKRFILGE